MNLVVEPEEKLEELPKREKFGPDNDWSNRDYPSHSRVNNFLESRLGRKWDKVASEFCHCDWVATRYRVPSFLRKFVEVHTYMKDGQVMCNVQHWYWDIDRQDDVALERLGSTFYVDPKSKRLWYWRKPIVRKPQVEVDWLMLGKLSQLIKQHGVWFHYWTIQCEFTDRWVLPNQSLSERSRFHVRHVREFNHVTGEWYYREVQPPDVHKQQLGCKELRRFGLKNDPPKLPGSVKKCKICGGWHCDIPRHMQNQHRLW